MTLLLFGLLLVADTPTQWTPELSMKVRSVADVLPSPDGKRVVWAETRSLLDGEKSESQTHIFIANSDGTERRQITRGEKSATSPAFSPDGKYLYFSSARSGKPNVFRLALDGGEAESVIDFRGAVASYRLSPDGKTIAFTGALDDPAAEKATKEKTDWKVIDANPPNQTLWVSSSDPALKKPARRVVSLGYHIGPFDWSPDSRRIAYQHVEQPSFDVARFSDVSEVDVESGAVTAIANTAATETSPVYSPDGKFIAYERTQGAVGAFAGVRVALYARSGGAVRDLAATFDERPNITGWAPDSKRLLITEGRKTRAASYWLPVDGPPVEVYAPGRGVFQGMRMNETGTHVGFAQSTPDDAAEAYVLDLGAKTTKRVSAANQSLPKPPLGETRLVTWKSKDGMEIEGLLTLPAGYQRGSRVPLILNIHGGPAGAFNEAFIGAGGLYPIAAFAAKGWATLRPNPRGSAAYGRKFRMANYQDWGGKDYEDLMTGVDSLIAQGIADPDRLAVMGWSYGGYMTSWIVTQTPRFKAAAMGAGITNLVSMWGTNDIPSTLNDYFGGPFWDQWKGYVERSAMAHVGKVTTPTLILHGERDNRVPTSQGQEFYTALKRKGVPTQMVVYPRTEHGPREPKFVLDIMQRHISWVEQHLSSPPSSPAPAQ